MTLFRCSDCGHPRGAHSQAGCARGGCRCRLVLPRPTEKAVRMALRREACDELAKLDAAAARGENVTTARADVLAFLDRRP